MKILITGGAGYLGSILTPELLMAGHKVILYDNFTWGVKSILHFASHPNLEIITGDVRDAESLKREIKKCDTIIHLAAIVGFPACAIEPEKAISINVGGTKNIVENMTLNQNLIFASTGSTYGAVEDICTEETPIAPLTLYGSTKAEAESMCMEKDAISLRFATVFGVSPRLRIDLLINDFTYLAIHKKEIILFEGSNKRTFLHARDTVNSILFSINNFDKMKNNVFNVGDEKLNYTKREITLAIKKQVDFYLHEADVGEDPDKRDYEVSYEKLKNMGYKTEVSLDEGISELIKVLKHIYMSNEWRNH